MTTKLNNKGISLAMTIGLLSLIMVASAFSSNLVIQSLHSAHKIESADRAFFAAEGGMEDALYELSNHFSGYETPVRTSDFSHGIDGRWESEWDIKNIMVDAADYEDKQLLKEQKLVISSYYDDSGDGSNPGTNAISVLNDDIVTINSGASLSVAFRVPYDDPASGTYSQPFTGYIPTKLVIDNDGDGFVNEDGPGTGEHKNTTADCGTPAIPSNDADCDNREDEDHENNPVITWQIKDESGNSFSPRRGCMTGTGDPNDPLGSEICEKDFVDLGLGLTAFFNNGIGSVDGFDQDGTLYTITNFLNTRNPGDKVDIEFLIVAPLKQSYDGDYGTGGTNRQVDGTVEIPHLLYTVTTVFDLPLPYFTIRSSGWYGDFRQSILSYITPKTSAPLLGGIITIIQQD